MSPVNVPVNADKVRERVNERHLSDRQVSDILGLGLTGSRSLMLDGTIHPATTLATLQRLTTALGLTYGELFDPDEPADRPADHLAHDERVTILTQLLPGRRAGVPLDHLAVVFGINYDELHTDLAEAERRLARVGYDLRVTFTGVIAPRKQSVMADDVEASLNQFRDSREGMLINHAQVLYRAMTGTLSTRGLSNDERVSIGYLTARDALTAPESTNRAALSDDTLYCLNPPENP